VHAAEALHKQLSPLVHTRRLLPSSMRSHGRKPPVSHNSPTGPTFRANSFPEVTNLICRLPLPTLFYRLEAVHLGDLLRISVRSGRKFINLLPSHFQGPYGAHGTPQEPRCFTGPTSLSQAEPLPGTRPLNQKRELWPGLHTASASSFALPRSVTLANDHLPALVWEY
jgi:hypothetical protein